MKNKNWTPVDSFVTEYGYRHNKTFVYQPGSGEATMKTGAWFGLDALRALIKSVEHHELQINIDGTIFVYVPEEPGEEAEAPEEEHELTPEEQEALRLANKALEDLETTRLDQDEIAEAIEPGDEDQPEIIVEEEKPVEELIPV